MKRSQSWDRNIAAEAKPERGVVCSHSIRLLQLALCRQRFLTARPDLEPFAMIRRALQVDSLGQLTHGPVNG